MCGTVHVWRATELAIPTRLAFSVLIYFNSFFTSGFEFTFVKKVGKLQTFWLRVMSSNPNEVRIKTLGLFTLGRNIGIRTRTFVYNPLSGSGEICKFPHAIYSQYQLICCLPSRFFLAKRKFLWIHFYSAFKDFYIPVRLSSVNYATDRHWCYGLLIHMKMYNEFGFLSTGKYSHCTQRRQILEPK